MINMKIHNSAERAYAVRVDGDYASTTSCLSSFGFYTRVSIIYLAVVQ
jgi:hypothetical protein